MVTGATASLQMVTEIGDRRVDLDNGWITQEGDKRACQAQG
jgi:hypothetical protein